MPCPHFDEKNACFILYLHCYSVKLSSFTNSLTIAEMLFAAIGLRYAFPIDVYISSGFSRNEDAQSPFIVGRGRIMMVLRVYNYYLVASILNWSRAHMLMFRIAKNKLFEWGFSRVLASHGGPGSIPGRDMSILGPVD